MRSESSSPTTVEEYIAGFSKDVQKILKNIRKLIRDAAPEAEEAIKYQIPTFVLNGNLFHFAAFERHIGFYPTPAGIVRFAADLAGYKSAKGSVQFPLDRPIPYDLIQKIVDFRVAENRAKKSARVAKKKSN